MSAPLDTLPTWLQRRPLTRAECPPPDQQCPWVSCRYHLALDVQKRTRLAKVPRLILSLPEAPSEWPDEAPTCALHVADGGAHTLEDVGAILGNISRERVRQLEQAALDKLAALGIVLDLGEDLHLDTSTRAPRNQRPSAEAKGHRPETPRARGTDADLDGTYVGGFRAQDMTAKMRKIQAESAAPVKTVTLSPEEIARVEAEIRAKQPAPRANATNARVTADTFTRLANDPRASERYARSRESLQSFRRLTAPDSPAKAPTTTQPRPPSPPSTASLESPPTIQAEAAPPAPATVQADDQPEVAVVTALPVDPSPPQPTPKVEPMPAPNPRGHWRTQRAYAVSRLKDELAERRITANALAQTIAAAHPELRVTSAVGSVNKLLDGGGSPISVWFRRAAIALGLSLSDLCDDPVWLAAVTTEGAPAVANSQARSVAVAPYEPAVRHTATLALTSGAAPPTVTVDVTPLPTREDALAPLILDLLTKSQAQDKRVNELSAVVGILRAEIDDLQQQLAERTRERDAAVATLARVKAAL